MKKITILILFMTWFSFSQNKQILYGFSEIPQSLLLNPGGEVKNDWYFGIPLLSHIHGNIGLSGSTVYDLFADNNINFNTKLQNAVYSMKPTDFFRANQQLEIFSGGFAFGNTYEKKEYLSFGLYQESSFLAYFPKDYAVLALEGNQTNINRIFNANHFSAQADVVSVLHLGYNKKVSESFTFGFRGKIYSNIINLSSTKNRGTLITQVGDNNFYNHIFNLDIGVKTSGLASLTEDSSSFEMNDLTKRILFGENLGLGFDVGFTYTFKEQWTFDASLLDIGFIKHSKDVENYSIKGEYIFDGINPIFPDSGSGQTADEYWTEIEKEFEGLFTIDTTATAYTTWRPVKLNASLNYAFGRRTEKDCNCLKGESGFQNAIGMHLFAISTPKQPQLALTAYYYRRLIKGLRVKATYTIDPYSYSNIGLGLSAHIGSVNFYVMADNFLEYKNIYSAQSVSLQLGFNYIFNKNED